MENPLLQGNGVTQANPLLVSKALGRNPLLGDAVAQPRQSNNRLARGVDVLQGTFGAAIQAGGEIAGYDAAIEMGKEIRAINKIEADREAAQADSIGESLIEAAPMLGTVLGMGGAGLAVGGPVGGLVGLALGSFGVNLGTVKEIQEDLGDFEESGAGTLATAAGATAVDVLTGGGIGKGATVAIKEAVKKTLTKRVAEGAALGTVGAGGAQAILDVGSNVASGIEIDEDRAEAIAENVALTAAFGASLGGLGGGVVGGVNKLRTMQDAYDERVLSGKAGYQEMNPVALENEDGFIRKGIGVVFGKPYDRFNNQIQANSFYRELKAMGNQTRAERASNIVDSNTNKSINTVTTEASLQAQKYRPILEEVGRLSKTDQKLISMELATKSVDEMSPIAKKIKTEYLDTIVDDLNGQGFAIKKHRNFLPLSQDIKRIRDNREVFETEMLDNARGKMDDVEYKLFKQDLEQYTTDLISNGGETSNSAIAFGGREVEAINLAMDGDVEGAKKLLAVLAKDNKSNLKVSKRNPAEMGRFLSAVDQEVLEKWGNKATLFERLNNYNNSISERVGWAKNYGKDGEILREKLLSGMLEELKAGRAIDPRVSQRFIDIANAQQRQFKRITDPKVRKAMEAVRTYQYVRTLPSAVLSSLVEPFLIMEGIGGKFALTGAAKALKQVLRSKGKAFAEKTNVKGAELDRVVDDFNVSMKNSLSGTAQKYDADAANLNNWEAGLFKVNGLAYWTEFNRMMAGYAADDAMLSATRKLAKGGLSKRKQAALTEKLRQAGLNEEDALEAFDSNTGKWNTTSPAYERVKAAGMNLIDDVVIKPDAGNRPLWQSDPHMQLVAQLKGWTTVFGNTVMTRWADKIHKSGAVGNIQQAQKLALFMGMYTTGLLTQTAIKDVVNDGEFELDDREFKDLLLLAVGQVGPLGLLTDSVAGGRGGTSRTAIGLVGGPTGSQVVDTVGQVGGVLNGTTEPSAAIREIMMSLTLPNVPAVGAVRDLLREAWD